MIFTLISAASFLAAASAATGDGAAQDVPPECVWGEGETPRWAECAAAAEPGSPVHMIANMNLGTQAFMERDFEAASRYYDNTLVDDRMSYSDAFLHAYRGLTYHKVGRTDDAMRDVTQVLHLIELDRADMRGRPLTDGGRKLLYMTIIEVLHDVEAPELGDAVDAYLALPVESWKDSLNRAAVLSDVEEYEAALPFSEAALEDQPDMPMLLSNHCSLLGNLGRADEALSYCERAVAAEPNEAAFHDNLAGALSRLGRCEEALTEQSRAIELSPAHVGYKEPLDCTPSD
jgi:tetratricopeptide (TPR) repeat protein